MLRTLLVIVVSLFWVSAWAPLPAAAAGKQENLYYRYTDPQRRFSLDYPATMRVDSTSPDEVRFSHSHASFRISVFVEKRQSKHGLTAENLLEALTKKLQEEMAGVSILGHGKLPGLGGSQAYLIVSFQDMKGLELVQLVQYYVTPDRILQLTLSDRPEGFKNLATVIQRVHHSLKILDPKLR